MSNKKQLNEKEINDANGGVVFIPKFGGKETTDIPTQDDEKDGMPFPKGYIPH